MADETTPVTPPAPAPAPAAAPAAEVKAKKAPSKLNIGECLAELEEMKDDVEFDRKWDDTTPLADLRALVKEGRAVLAEGADLPKVVDQAMLDENPMLVDHGVKVGDPIKVASDLLSAKLNAAEGGAPKEGGIGAPEGGRTVRDVFAVSREDVIVRLPDGSRRLYSEKSHGQHWQTLAAQYAESQHGVFE